MHDITFDNIDRTFFFHNKLKTQKLLFYSQILSIGYKWVVTKCLSIDPKGPIFPDEYFSFNLFLLTIWIV